MLKPDGFRGRTATCEEQLSACHLPRKAQVIVQASGLRSAPVLSTWFWSTRSSLIHALFWFPTCVSMMFLVNCLLFGNTEQNQRGSEVKSQNPRSIEFTKTNICKPYPIQPSFASGCSLSVKCSSGESSCTGRYLHCVKNVCLGL